MPARMASAAIILSVLLAGCSLRGGESREATDRDDYEGGAGLAVALRNNGTDPFDVEIVALGAGGARAAEFNVTLAPGETVEKWWTIDRAAYDVRMVYHWSAQTGRASTGFDNAPVDLNDCPLVSRVSFVFEQWPESVGHTLDPKTCVTPDDE